MIDLNSVRLKKAVDVVQPCYHCGEPCRFEKIDFDGKIFCCQGCQTVYDLLLERNLCTYYNLNGSPGISPRNSLQKAKFDYLDQEETFSKLIQYQDQNQIRICFYIPAIHCNSCIWLLENLHKLNSNILSSEVNFLKKEATIIFDSQKIKLSEVVILMADIGYEPLINLNNLEVKKPEFSNQIQLLKIGLAGFCFGNIMMLSFPEYFSLGNFFDQAGLRNFFGYLNLLLAIPVFFFAANEFFISAWKSIQFRYLNIDAPIALAILVTFLRSVYEILSMQGVGYLDSMTGIVFFMLIGRFFQNRTYDSLSFERDYRSYFPVGVSVVGADGKEESHLATNLKKGDKIIIRSHEIIPADAILLSKDGQFDYSFITGESQPVWKKKGDMIFAGGKKLGGAVELEVLRPTSQSYLTKLWNQDTNKPRIQSQRVYIDSINRYFTMAVLLISAISGIYWVLMDPSLALNAITAVLIVACPCGLLLTTTFTNGNVLRVMGRNKLYLKNAQVIDKLNQIDTIVFDKTGTISHGSKVVFVGWGLSREKIDKVCNLASQSAHPLSRKIHSHFSSQKRMEVKDFEEYAGAGIRGKVDGSDILLGSDSFVCGYKKKDTPDSTKVFLKMDGQVLGFFEFSTRYREGLKSMVDSLNPFYDLELMSGDNDAERSYLSMVFGAKAQLQFNLKPAEKMEKVANLKSVGKKVMMIGDGLNDAGALQSSDVGVAISDDTNTFSPSCDAILDGSSLYRLPALLKFSKWNKRIIIITFCISLFYNIVGLFFAVQGALSPVVAAILMPISSISIVLLTTGLTFLVAKIKKLI